MKVKFKKLHPNAVIPSYAKDGDAGLDLTCVGYQKIDTEHVKYNTGLALEIPNGYVGFLFPRSSCYKKRQILSNCVGVIDSGYRGQVSLIMIGNHNDYMYKAGDRIGQLIIMPYPQIEPEEVGDLSESERGEGGFGSTGI